MLLDISVMKVAIELCNNSELKREILCAPGSDYDINNKASFEYANNALRNEIVEEKAIIIMQNFSIAKQLQEKVICIVHLVGRKMLTWAVYHERTLGFSREYIINFLNGSFFAQKGIVDEKKAAEELIKDKNLSIKQKYALACLYCFTEQISAFYGHMTEEDKEIFCDVERSECIKQTQIVKFWTYYLTGEMNKLKEERNLYQYRLEKAVESGVKAAVEYCLEKTN